MTRWQYQIVLIDKDGLGLEYERKLNEQGRLGWELVSVIDPGPYSRMFKIVMKAPAP